MTRPPGHRYAREHVGRLLFICLLGGCTNFDANRRQVLAQNDHWTVWAVGDLQSYAKGFETTEIRFEVVRQGARYAEGELYEAGSHDNSFDVQYPVRDWISPDVLRLYRVSEPDRPSVSLMVRNEGRSPIKWLKIRSAELLLMLGLPSGASRATLTRRWGDDLYIHVSGLFASGQVFEGVGRSSSIRPDQFLEVSIRENDVRITQRDQPVEDRLVPAPAR